MVDREIPQRVHLVGAGGAGMSGLAKLLAQSGHEVSGSDVKPGRFLDALGDLGIVTWLGHRPDLLAGVGLVVASSAVPSRDPEISAAVAAGIPVWERPALLEALTARHPAIGVAGTHGKTSGTALAVAAARGLGLDPTFLVGGQLVGLNTNAHLGNPEMFLLEADEAFGTFEVLTLAGLLVTSIEADHLDHYGTLEHLEAAFARVAAATAGPVVACADDPGSRRLAATGAVTYGTAPEAVWRIVDIEHGPWDVGFGLVGPSDRVRVRVPRPGMHMARNAAGVVALFGELGFDPATAAAGLDGFSGVHRRFEVKARLRGVTVVDDYAHHPTEIAATLEAGRLGGWGRVWAVFQPHRYTRTAALAAEFGDALAGADEVIVTDVYPADERPIPGVTGRLVADAAIVAGADVAYLPHRRDVAPYLVPRLQPGDLVLMLGAGDITAAADELALALGRQP